MAFKNLERRFNENVNKLYAGATLKFDNGIASNGRTDAPLIVRKPGDGQVGITLEGRSLPVVSAAQDLKRLTLFQLSRPGLLFLAKQQLLQTGNTFEFTRALNPAFVVANAVPFLHVKRNLRPLGELTGKTDTSYENVRKLGQLQVSTYNNLYKKSDPKFISQYLQQKLFGKTGPDKPTGSKNILGALSSRITGAISGIVGTTLGTLSAFSPLQKRNIGDKFGYGTPATPVGWNQSRPELNSIVNATVVANNIYHTDYKKFFTNEFDTVPFIKYFESPDGLKRSDPGDAKDGPKTSVVTRAANKRNKTLSYVKDPANAPNLKPGNGPEAYKPINHKFEDAIVVSFAMGKDAPIQFRAFIKDLNQTATPEYKAYQYIGRMEKFVNYVGVQREISFKLGIVAFGPDELKAVWRRINYLTGLVFPYGFNKGIMQPNIARLTIGNVYVDQPGYVTGLSTNFTELGESWELDAGRQVPLAAQMDIKFTLIEKATRIADSPFYGITDGGINTKGAPGTPMSGFSREIPVPKPKNATANSTQDAAQGEKVKTYSIETRDKKVAESFNKLVTLDPTLFPK